MRTETIVLGGGGFPGHDMFLTGGTARFHRLFGEMKRPTSRLILLGERRGANRRHRNKALDPLPIELKPD